MSSQRVSSSREYRSPSAYRTPTREYDQSSYAKNHTDGDAKNAYSDDARYDARVNATTMNDELIKEARLVSNFMYGNKTKADTYSNSRRSVDTKANVNRKNVAPNSGRYNI